MNVFQRQYSSTPHISTSAYSTSIVLFVVVLVIAMFGGCTPSEPTRNSPDGNWQLLVVTDGNPSQFTLLNQPGNTIVQQNLFSRLGAGGIGGRISRIVTFRDKLYVIMPEQFKIEVLILDSTSLTYARRATMDFSRSQRVPADIAFMNATSGYIAFSNSSLVGVIDIADTIDQPELRGKGLRPYTMVDSIVVGANPVDLQVHDNEADNRLYCALRGENAIAIINTSTKRVEGRIPTPPAPLYVNITANRANLVVIGAGNGRFNSAARTPCRAALLNIATRQIANEISIFSSPADSLSEFPFGLAVTDQDFAFVPMNRALVRLDVRTLARSIPQQSAYRGITYNPLRGELLLTVTDSVPACSIVDTQTGIEQSRIPLPVRPAILFSR